MASAAEIRQWFNGALAEYESKATAAEAEERAYKLRRAEHDALEKQQLARLADLAKKTEEARDLLEAVEREAELVRTKTRGERDQILAQARSEADAMRKKYKAIVKDLEAA